MNLINNVMNTRNEIVIDNLAVNYELKWWHAVSMYAEQV